MFDTKYQETPDDINLLKRIVMVLDKKDCTDAEVYFSAAKQLHEIKPSADYLHIIWVTFLSRKINLQMRLLFSNKL